VHLDTLDRERFRTITRRDDFARVMAGIDACMALGYSPIKINAVAVKNLVEPDIVPLARFGRERGIEIRYIEFMPLDAQGLWLRDKVLSMDDMMAMLTREIGPARTNSRRRSARAGDRVPLCRWCGPRGFYCVSDQAVLPELQPAAADGGWQAPVLSICGG
jgi:molybdenum cofactor biosynthesis enzyme MoaA